MFWSDYLTGAITVKEMARELGCSESYVGTMIGEMVDVEKLNNNPSTSLNSNEDFEPLYSWKEMLTDVDGPTVGSSDREKENYYKRLIND